MSSIQRKLWEQRAGLVKEENDSSELISEASIFEPDLTDMGRSELWHAHSEVHELHHNMGYGKKHKELYKKIHAHVAKVHGKEMADDMHKHSELQSSEGNKRSALEALKLRKKHNINRKDGVGTNWHHTGEKDDKEANHAW
jgi:hypothetical protein